MEEETPKVAGPGSVVLDIGEDIGAAVVTGPPSMEGHEVEIRAASAAWDGRHVAFHLRETAEGLINAAVFPQLVQGRWEIRLRSPEDRSTVPLVVVGGQVTTVALPTLLKPGSP
jgi:hypothetical protein